MAGSIKLIIFYTIINLLLGDNNAFIFDNKDLTLESLTSQIKELIQQLKTSNKFAEGMAKEIGSLSRQVMLQQLFIEERIRSEGQSGIKQIRKSAGGTKSYHSNSHGGKRVAAIHDHSNNIRTVGMGELIAVLNGVEFRTRHNDYRLYMPSRTSRDYHATEEIPFPDVPPEVTSKNKIAEQVKEMVEWFKAWKSNNYKKRDYRKYFKPVLCYLEGTWTKSAKNIDEPFESDRHFVDASSWFDLQEKIRFTSYTGRKDNLENFAYLPTTIMETINETTAVFAQWNYRILCHPLKTYLHRNRLRMVDDLGSRLPAHNTYSEEAKTRGARFQVNPRDTYKWIDGQFYFNLLDKLMGEIPGKDNYPANITDDAFDQRAYTMDPRKKGKTLNAGYYHRWYKVLEKGAMGIQNRHRGFSDPNLFMAMTTQGNVAGMKLNNCRMENNAQQCTEYSQKWSYAIPLEIIYLTPLNKWNPYNLTYKGSSQSRLGKTVSAKGRNGGVTEEKAFDGINSKTYYITPDEFFSGAETQKDAADTTRGSVGVLDPTRKVRRVRASGIRIFLPDIPGVGILRQRYPIMPIHAEGNTIWKELEAVKDFLMQSNTHARLFREKLAPGAGGEMPPEKNTDRRFLTGSSRRPDFVSNHVHEVTLTTEEVALLKSGKTVSKVTSTAEAHQHDLKIAWNNERKMFFIASCQGTPPGTGKYRMCADLHTIFFKEAPNQ